MSSGRFGPAKEYKDFTENYSCGRIDIHGLDNEEYYGGQHEYSLSVMRTEDWNQWLNIVRTHTYNGNFEKVRTLIRWIGLYHE